MARNVAHKIGAKFLDHVNGYYFTNISLGPNHYRAARDWLGLFQTELKTLDSLLLAISHLEGMTLLTADHELAKSANALGLEVSLLNP